jgi:PEP-CTERM motif
MVRIVLFVGVGGALTMTMTTKRSLGGTFALAFAAMMMMVIPARAATILTFEGLGNLEPVVEFYDGLRANGGIGSGPGPNLGIVFSANALAIIDSDAGGTGNFGGEPSPDTIMFFGEGTGVTMNVQGGFTITISLYYSALVDLGSLTLFDGADGTGNLLATLVLPLTPTGGALDPTGSFSPLLPISLDFEGIALSAVLGGTAGLIGFDNITLNSVNPGPRDTTIPEPGSLVLLAVGALGAAGLHRWVGRR